ncbi:hypothetical protein [Cetobacterium sp. SF1]|uniref:hypothetical protein n=1 Tax=unclassified Cetobacterium TaxID=2630983 RepID=UPI003CEDA342
MKRNIGRLIIQILLVLGTFGILLYFVNAELEDLKEVSRVEEINKNLKDMRIALEKYYEETGTYPNLTLPGAKDNLKELDYINEDGKIISFAEIYGRNTIPKLRGIKNIPESNVVYDVQDFNLGNNMGGWNYNYTERTGEIHANLSDDAFSEKINWQRQ